MRVEEVDLFWLSIKLGNTVGDDSDVKALLPLLFERLVTSGELDAGIILGKLARQNWRSWPADEQSAIDELLDQLWLELLAEFPSRTAAFADADDFLRAVAAAGLPPDRFFTAWDATSDDQADRHLADFVNATMYTARLDPGIRAWIGRERLSDRLLRAFERHGEDSEWGDIFARAYDVACLYMS